MKIEGPVYVVDDDDAVRDSLALLLEAAGLRVEAFAGGAEALTRCQDERPSCVVTDVRMPQIDGLELQRRLAQLHAQLPVIVITGHGDVPLAVQAMKAGAADFIEKPFSDDVILASIGRRSRAVAAAPERRHRRQVRRSPRLPDAARRDVFISSSSAIPTRSSPTTWASAPARSRSIGRVMEKMEVRSLPELVRLAIEAGVEIPT